VITIVPRPRGGHPRRDVRRGGDRAHDVDCPRIELLCGGELPDHVGADERGVVDQQLGRPEAIGDLVQRAAQRRLVGGVGGDSMHLVSRQGAHRRDDRGVSPRDHPDGHPLAGGPPGHGETDSRTGADDDR
jgi:hypothetical protein